jgi:hypothetical protein
MPLAGIDLHTFVGEDATGSATTDREGCFDLSFACDGEAIACEGTLVGWSRHLGSARLASFVLERGRMHDWGDLRFEARRPFATGVLVTDRPIGAAAGLCVEREAEGQWIADRRFAVDLDDDGSFAVHGFANRSASGQRLRLVPNVPGFVRPKPVEFVEGQHVRFELERGPSFRARVVVGPEIDRHVARHHLDLLVQGADGIRTFLDSELREGEWIFESDTLAPGVYSLAIESGVGYGDLATLDAVRVFADEPTDARLQPWDLRGHVQMTTIRLLRADGTRLDANGEVYRRDPSTSEWANCGSIENGVAQFLTTAAPSDLAFEVFHRGTFRQNGVLGVVDVFVPEPRSVAVALRGLPKLQDGTHLACSVELVDGWHAANGLPDSEGPLFGSEWDEPEQRLRLQVSQAAEVDVEVHRCTGDQSELVGRLRIVVPADRESIEVPCPATMVAALQPFAYKRTGGSR